MNREGKVYVFDHPLIQHKVTLMRQTSTTTKEFRELAREVVTLMTFEATRDLPLKDVEIETPITKCTMKMLAGEDIAIVPILRAGLGFVDGMLDLIPNAKVGHIGLYRDPFVVDPMLATGGSAIAAIDFIKMRHVENINFMCLIAAPEGIEALQKAHPDVNIYIAAKDDHLNEHAYIVPGLGDAGDRLYGTK